MPSHQERVRRNYLDQNSFIRVSSAGRLVLMCPPDITGIEGAVVGRFANGDLYVQRYGVAETFEGWLMKAGE